MSADRHFDDPVFRHEFPHPLAALYDLLRDPADTPRLTAALGLAEGLARYLAWTLLADAAARGATRAELAKYTPARSFGAWLNVLQHLVRARPAPARLYPELDALLASPWWTSFDRLRALRNDAAHGRVNLGASAGALFQRHRADLVTVLDGCAFLQHYPLGMLAAVRNDAAGQPTGTWRACRGQTPRGSMIELPDAHGIPGDRLLLVDVGQGVVLTLAPFLCLIEDEFVWLDLPVTGDDRRCPYLSPIPGRPLKSGVPAGLFDPDHPHGAGVALEAWLDGLAPRPRYTPLPPGSDALPRILSTSRATMKGVPSRGPEASIGPVGVSRSPAPAPSSLTSVPPTERAAAHAGRSWGKWMIGTGALLGAVAVGVAVTAIGRTSAEVPRVEDRPTGPAPSEVPTQVDLAPVSSWAPVDIALRRWNATIRAPEINSSLIQPLYADPVLFRTDPTSRTEQGRIVSYWRSLFGSGGTLDVDWSTSEWRREPLSNLVPSACIDVPGASDGFVLVRLHVTENDPDRPNRTRDAIPCARLRGIYVIRMRYLSGVGLKICHEGWPLADGICAPGSCPETRRCQTPGR